MVRYFSNQKSDFFQHESLSLYFCEVRSPTEEGMMLEKSRVKRESNGGRRERGEKTHVAQKEKPLKSFAHFI